MLQGVGPQKVIVCYIFGVPRVLGQVKGVGILQPILPKKALLGLHNMTSSCFVFVSFCEFRGIPILHTAAPSGPSSPAIPSPCLYRACGTHPGRSPVKSCPAHVSLQGSETVMYHDVFLPKHPKLLQLQIHHSGPGWLSCYKRSNRQERRNKSISKPGTSPTTFLDPGKPCWEIQGAFHVVWSLLKVRAAVHNKGCFTSIPGKPAAPAAVDERFVFPKTKFVQSNHSSCYIHIHMYIYICIYVCM